MPFHRKTTPKIEPPKTAEDYLLRASSAEDSPAILQRPASSPPEQHQAQLLRPAISDSEKSP